MSLLDFTLLKPKDTFQYLAQLSGSEVGTGLGVSVKNLAVTSSWADNATSASYAGSSSWTVNAVSASYSISASFEILTELFSTSSISSSWASASISSSHALRSDLSDLAYALNCIT